MKQEKDLTGEIVIYQPDETIRLEVRTDGETVWLSANQMAILFDRDEKTVRKYHIGASLKDLGKKWFAFTLLHDNIASELLNRIEKN